MTYKDITYQQLQDLHKKNNVLLIDVRSSEEYMGSLFPDGSLLSTSQNIPLDDLSIDELKWAIEEWWCGLDKAKADINSSSSSDKVLHVCFICRSGMRSVQAIKLLQQQMSEEGLDNTLVVAPHTASPKQDISVTLEYYNLAGGIKSTQ